MDLPSYGRARWFDPSIAALTQRQSCVTCDSGYASGILLTLLTGRPQRHVSGQGGDPLQPNAHRRVGSEVEAALEGDGRVNVEGDVGYCGAISDEELAAVAEVPLHHGQGPVPLLEELLQLGLPLRRDLDLPHAPEAGTGEVRQKTVLLEEHPAQDLSPLQLLFGEVGRALREIEQDRAGLREHCSVFELQDRYLAVRVDVL